MLLSKISYKSAFSLVELSIVLVILGLLVGGVLSGQSLIRAAELRKVSTDATRYRTAIYAFRDKYFALPGDMANASQFWTKSDRCGGASATGTCDGNGDGFIIRNGWEMGSVFQQLALGGFIEGSYLPPSTGCGSDESCLVMGQQIPKTFRNGGIDIHDLEGSFGPAAGVQSNGIKFGRQRAPGANYSDCGIFTPEEVWNIDTKFDDGLYNSGAISGDHSYAGTAICGYSSQYCANTSYTLSLKDPACTLRIRL